MFRQSDEVARRPHASYLNRPTPELQIQGRYGQFDSRTSTNVAQESALKQAGPQPTPIPAAHDTFYDPTNPQADWGGLVSKVNNQKTHTYNDHRAQNQGIEHTEDGMVSKEERQEFAHRRRANDQLVTTTKQTYQMASVITPGFDRWQTTHASFEAQEATSRDQLTYQRRAGTRRVVNDPAQAKGKEYYNPYDSSQFPTPRMGGGENRQPNTNPNSQQSPSSSSSSSSSSSLLSSQQQQHQQYQHQQQYQQQPQQKQHQPMPGRAMGGGKSLIAGIGASLVNSIQDDMPKCLAQNEMDRRSLLLQNYNPNPGYTGTRKL